MKLEFEERVNKAKFLVRIKDGSFKGEGMLHKKAVPVNTIALNTAAPQQVTIDQVQYTMPANSILPLVANQHFVFERPEELIAWQFNRDFYCIADHDAEVGCVGFLFYGIQHPLFIALGKEELGSISMIESLCVEDMHVVDQMQGEMLRTLLKRLIILVTRVAKKQTENYQRFTDEKMDMVRKFNLLLEVNYRNQHEVRFYANALNKSPKTLTNIFGQCNYPPPSRLIQNRIISETKRYLLYTEKSAKEVAAELGFTSAAHFSRFFKSNTGTNFSDFRKSNVKER